MRERYFTIATLLERLHRMFLDVVRIELERCGIRDLSNVQALIVYNLANEKLTVGEIANRGYYLGSNVSYNLKKLVESGYILYELLAHDKRSAQVMLSPKGLKAYKALIVIFDAHVANMALNGIDEAALKDAMQHMRKLESFWSLLMLHLPKS